MRPAALLLLALVSACANTASEDEDDSAADLSTKPTLTVPKLVGAIAIDGAGDEAAWASAPATTFATAWNGKPTTTVTTVKALHDERALYMLWELAGTDLNVDASRPIDVERDKLYQEDCVEIFFTPDPAVRQRYFEIELGPRGHFFDLLVDHRTNVSDTSWSSGLTIRTKVDEASHHATIEVTFTNPEIVAAVRSGKPLPIDMFRMEGKSPNRQYLAWSPTLTPRPNFHVPAAFGTLVPR